VKKVIVIYGNPGSVDITLEEVLNEWQKLSLLADVHYELRHFDTFPTPEAFNAAMDADVTAILGAWITNGFFNQAFYDSHPNLRYIGGLAHGYQELDWQLSRDYNIVITNTTYGEHTIAEYAFALLLEICKQPAFCSHHVKTTDWSQGAQKYMNAPVRQLELYQKTFGVVGLGSIGFHAAMLAQAFGMRVVAYNRHRKTAPEFAFLEQLPLDEVLAQSDVVSLHVALNEQTRGFINREAIARMKDGAILINTARGALVDEEALAEALRSGKLTAAGLDVLTNEPPKADNPLLLLDNALITPHIAWMPKTCRMRQISMAIDNYAAFLQGSPVSVINQR